ncbi:MAG: GNAT family N-acetyltransferase [Candidatus Eisenbacteria bacterium]|nr:GNAT family N-acetyltransferase [Candidatus Eisenbacteria bacterium]MCC7141010.1 GNAT family N-acetyltransferase [Candidatus Eisenbacteria bacterium]
MRLSFRPLTDELWPDLESLFGPRGACAGCWCMYWRGPAKQFKENSGDPNKRALRTLVRKGGVPGILAYRGKEPVGWCAIEPREAYPRLEAARTLKRIDDLPVWSITCLFVAKEHRRTGVSVALLGAAVKHAKRLGAEWVEGYPTSVADAKLPDPWIYTGTEEAFLRAGFTVAARPARTRPIMRYPTRSRSAAR